MSDNNSANFSVGFDVEQGIKNLRRVREELMSVGATAERVGNTIDGAFSDEQGPKKLTADIQKTNEAVGDTSKALQDVAKVGAKAFETVGGSAKDAQQSVQGQTLAVEKLTDGYEDLGRAAEKVSSSISQLQKPDGANTRIQNAREEKAALEDLYLQCGNVGGAAISLRKEMKETHDAMVMMAYSGKDAGAEYEELSKKLQDLKKAYKKVFEDQKAGGQLNGIMSAMTGLSGAMSAGIGVVSLFTDNTEKLAKQQKNLQAAMATVMGAMQISNTLKETSAFRMKTLASLKQWWAKIVEAATMAEKKETVGTVANIEAKKLQNSTLITGTGAKVKDTLATEGQAVAAKTGTLANLTLAGAFRAVGVAIKSIPVFGWILTGLAAAAGLIALFTSASRKAAKAAKEFHDSVVEGSYKAVGSVMNLSQQWSSLTDDDSKKKFIEDNKKAFEDLGVSVNSVAEAEKLLVDDKGKFIDAMIEKAKAAIYLQQATDKVKNLMDLEAEIAKTPDKITVGTRETGYQDIDNPAKARLKKDHRELLEIIEQGYRDGAEATKKSMAMLGETASNAVKGYEDGMVGAIQEAIQKEQEAIKRLSDPKLILESHERVRGLQDQLEAMTSEYAAGTVGFVEAQISRQQKALKSLSDPQAYEAAKKHIELLQKQLATLTGDTSASDAKKQLQSDILSMLKDAADQIEEAKIKAMEDGQEKRRLILERDQQKELDALAKHRDGLVKKLSEEAGHAVELTDAQKKMYDDWAQTITDAYDKAKKAASDFEQIKNKYLSFEQEIAAIKQQYATEEATLLAEQKNHSPETTAYQEITENLIELAKRRNEDLAKLYGEQTSAKMRMIEAQRDMELAGIAKSKYLYATDRKRDMLLVQKKAAEEAREELIKAYEKTPTEELAKEIAQLTAEIDAMGKEIEKLPAEKFQELLSGLQGITSALSGLGGEVGEIFSGIGTALDGIKLAADDSVSAWDKAGSAIANVVGIINLVAQASANRRKEESQFQQDQIALAHKYALALNEQLRIQSELSGGGFVTDYTGKLKNGFESLRDATDQYREALEKLSEGKVKIDLKNAVDWGAVGKSAGMGAAIGATIGNAIPVIGTLIGTAAGAIIGGLVGIFGGKKKKDIFGGLLDVYPELVDGAGQLNQQLAQTLIDTSKVDDKTKQILQNALDWADAMAQAKEQMRGVVTELAGDLGNSLQNALVEAFKAGEGASTRMFDAATKSLEGLVENLLFSSIFNDVFSEFGDRLLEAITPDNGGDILAEYDWLMDQMDERSEIFFSALQMMKNRAGESGYDMWGLDGLDELAKMDKQLVRLEKLKQDALASDAENEKQLEIEKARLENLKELIRANEELSKTPPTPPAIDYSNLENQDIPAITVDVEMPALLDEIEAKLELAKLEESIQKREDEIARKRHEQIQQNIEDLEEQKEKYKNSLQFIEEQIKLIENEWASMTLDERASDRGKQLIADRQYYEERRKMFRDMLDDEAQSIAEGSIAWLDAQISEIDDRLKNFTRDELSSEVGNQLKAQKAEYEQARQEMQDLMSGEVSKEDVAGSRNRINQLLNDAKAQLDAMSILDPENAQRVAELNEMIKSYESQLAAIDAYIAALNEQDKTTAQLIESERAKYDLYQKWLDMYGEEKAQEMLTALLSNADTYIDRLEQGIADIEEKVLAGTATEEDMSLLDGWYSQRKDIYDALAKASEEAAQKALDAWNEAFNESLSEAETAFDKIAVLTKAMANLDISGLNDEQIAAQRADLSKQLLNETKSLEKELLREFETTAKKRERIEREYNQKIQFLRDEANEGRYEEEAKLAEEARDKELSEIEKSILEQSELWKQLFGGDLAKLGKKAAEQALAELRKAIEESVVLTDEVRDEILASLDQVQEDLNQIELDALNKRLEETKQKFDDIASTITALGTMLSDLGADSEITDMVSNLGGLVSGIGGAFAAFSSGNILGGINAVMGIIGSVAKVFQWFTTQRIASITKEVNNLTRAYSQLERAIQTSLGTGTAKLQAEQVKNIDQQIAKNNELIRLEEKKWFTDKARVQELKDQNEQLRQQQEDITRQMAADFLQTDAKSYASQLADVLTAPYDSLQSKMAAAEEASLKMVQNIIKNSLKLRFLEKPVQDAMDALYANGQTLDKNAFEDFQNTVKVISENFSEEWDKFAPWFESMEDKIERGTTDGIKSITEPQANQLLAQITGIRIELTDQRMVIEQLYNNFMAVQSERMDMLGVVRTIKDDTVVIAQHLGSIYRFMTTNRGQLAGQGYGGAL